MMKKNPALLDIYHASIRLDSVFFHDLMRDKRRWSSTRKFWRATLRYYVWHTRASLWRHSVNQLGKWRRLTTSLSDWRRRPVSEV
jgi:hypothetical protein